jgi:ankyrin repeat protein
MEDNNNEEELNSVEELQELLQEKENKIRELEKQLRRQKDRTENDSNNENELPIEESEEDEEDDGDLKDKIGRFLKGLVGRDSAISRMDLYLSTINTLSVLYHLDFDQELCEEPFQFTDLPASGKHKNKNRFDACKIAFSYTLEFFRQREAQQLGINNGEGRSTYGFPFMWLLGMFPYNKKPYIPTTDMSTLPLHFFLAVDTKDLPIERYLEDLELLLHEFGYQSFQEEVSPLCIAVTKSYPLLAAVEKILEFKSNADLLEDEDGSIPLQHACACNENTDVIDYLLTRSPKSIEKVDNFGGSAIHYATFSGSAKIVSFLLEKFPTCINFVEGNGALPLHDGVQNCRGEYNQVEITQMLLDLCPEAAFKRDNSGAFPFHRAVKSSNLQVAESLIAVFPKAVFAIDAEELLPIHYFSQRADKDQQLELLQYILKLNPKSTILGDHELFPKTKQKSTFSFFSREKKEEPLVKPVGQKPPSQGQGQPRQQRKSVVMNRRGSAAHHSPRVK